MLELTVTDLKQSAYCRRLPYYRYVLPVTQVTTYKMQRGRHAQGALEALEQRRGLREYGLASGERLFGVRLHSSRLGLTGHLDLLVRTATTAHPVDFKDTDGPVRFNHRVQIAAYALLVEEAYNLSVPSGYVYLVGRGEVEEVAVRDEERAAVQRRLDDVRDLVARESLPPPTRVRARCEGCEYRNYCADVW